MNFDNKGKDDRNFEFLIAKDQNKEFLFLILYNNHKSLHGLLGFLTTNRLLRSRLFGTLSSCPIPPFFFKALKRLPFKFWHAFCL